MLMVKLGSVGARPVLGWAPVVVEVVVGCVAADDQRCGWQDPGGLG